MSRTDIFQWIRMMYDDHEWFAEDMKNRPENCHIKWTEWAWVGDQPITSRHRLVVCLESSRRDVATY